jgi:hypothetical protein
MPTEPKQTSPLPPSDPASPDHAPVKSTTDARAGITFGRMRWVLVISVVAVAVVLIAIWATASR